MPSQDTKILQPDKAPFILYVDLEYSIKSLMNVKVILKNPLPQK